ncbi:glycosyltransferase family 2 protein (plasmid) [Rhizobium sullae]|uniref:Glycosyltransferase family 2 protein n=1 Tax=Rhizobium sullae TaxID=50338 RepID=A0ABY5XQN9_RHISU|nr:glycosyltransferase family A protein [Rhizobium sullae]UWU16938.1 glycosyltransferase family 2 protein [Rhizobium sullae]
MAELDILIPHFNDTAGLDLSLRSIEAQTWPGQVRVVIADDGSDALTKTKLREVAASFSFKIEIIENEENRGRPYTRNVLLAAIESPYVAWLDAGDEWYPLKLEKQFEKLAELEQTNGGNPFWVTCNYDWVWTGGLRRRRVQKVDGDQLKSLLIGSQLRAYLWTLIGPAATFKDVGWFDERLPRMQDLDFFIRFQMHGGRIYNATKTEPLCAYHKSDEGRKALEIRECNQIIFDKHRTLFRRYGDRFCEMRLFRMDMLAWRFAQNNGDIVLARHFMRKAATRRPIAFAKHVWKSKALRA